MQAATCLCAHPASAGTPWDTDIPRGYHAGLVLRGHSCLCQPWVVPRLQSVSARATHPKDRNRARLQPRATLTRASGGSPESSWGWQRTDPCNIVCRQHLPQGEMAIRVGRRHISIRAIKVGRVQGTLQPCAKPQTATRVHRDWANALFSLYLNPAVTSFWGMEDAHIPAMPDPWLPGGYGAAPAWRWGSARLTPEPGHAEGQGGGHLTPGTAGPM